MPWEEGVRLYGTDYFVYLYNAIAGTYARYPWTVQISYAIVVLCILFVLFLLVFMAWDVYKRRRDARMFDALKQKYYNDLSEITHSSRELTPEEIIAKLDPDRVTEVSFAYRMRWIDLFILLRADTDLREPSITNIRRAMEALGVTAFMENRLIYGQDSENCG